MEGVLGRRVQVRWRGDGKQLYYLARDNRLMAVRIQLESTDDIVDAEVPVPCSSPVQRRSEKRRIREVQERPKMVSVSLVDTVLELILPITVIMNWEPKA